MWTLIAVHSLRTTSSAALSGPMDPISGDVISIGMQFFHAVTIETASDYRSIIVKKRASLALING